MPHASGQHDAGKHEAEARQRFNSRFEFLLSVIGFAVGIGNVWRFPAMAFANGGGAFLIIYLVVIAILGIPLVMFELSHGQLHQRSSVSVWRKAGGWRFIGVGLASISMTFITVMYYCVILAWSGVYFALSLRFEPAWGDDAESYFYNDILGLTESMNEVGTLRWPIVLALAISWLFVWASIAKGVQSSGGVRKFSVIFPYVILLVLLVRGVTLDGAGEGLRYFFIPRVEKLLDVQTWIAAISQVFFSLGPGWGILTSFGSFLGPKQNVLRDGKIVAGVNALTSILAGITTFSVLGFLAKQRGVSVPDVVSQGPELAFIVFPYALNQFGGAATFFAAMFFLMLFLLGVASVFGWIEVVVDVVHTNFASLDLPRAAALVCTVQFVLGLWFCTGSALYWVDMLNQFVPTVALYIIVACEIAAFAVYGPDKFLSELDSSTANTVRSWVKPTWLYVQPPLLIVAAVAAVIGLAQGSYSFPTWAIVLGWVLALSPLLLIAFFAVVKVTSNTKDPTQRTRPKNKNGAAAAASEHQADPASRSDDVEAGAMPVQQNHASAAGTGEPMPHANNDAVAPRAAAPVDREDDVAASSEPVHQSGGEAEPTGDAPVSHADTAGDAPASQSSDTAAAAATASEVGPDAATSASLDDQEQQHADPAPATESSQHTE